MADQLTPGAVLFAGWPHGSGRDPNAHWVYRFRGEEEELTFEANGPPGWRAHVRELVILSFQSLDGVMQG